MTSRWLKRNRVEIAGGAIALASLAFSIPGMLSNYQGMQEVSREIQRNALQQQRLEAQQESLKERASIAEERYRDCLLVQAIGKNKLISLSEGMPLVDSETGNPIPAGTVVCDHAGNTAVMDFNGTKNVALDLAFTGNRDAVRQALQRSGIHLVPGNRDYSSGTRVNQQP